MTEEPQDTEVRDNKSCPRSLDISIPISKTTGREAVFLRTTPREGIQLTAKTVDEDPASCKRWITRKEIKKI